MLLEELITYFRNNGDYEMFCKDNNIDVNTDVIQFYLKPPYNKSSVVKMVAVEDASDRIEVQIDGEKYLNAFSFYYIEDLMEEINNGEYKNMSDSDIINMVINYLINNA